MYFVTLSICVFFVSYTTCVQHSYKLIPEHCEIKNVNDSLVHFHFNQCKKFSRTDLQLSTNFSLKFDVLSDDALQLKITGYQFRSNEYRKGPIEFMLGACTAFESDQFDLPHMLANSNLRCPLTKGKTYYLYHLSPNATNMPPLIPDGRWMFEIKFLYFNKYVVAILEWYTVIEYPIRIQ